MKLILAMICMTAAASLLRSDEPTAELTFRKLISGPSTVTLSYEAADHLLELQAVERAGEDEIGIRYVSDGSPGISFGRAVYAGPLRMFVDPSRVLLPSDLYRRSLWSIRMSQLKQQRFAAAALGDFRDSQWNLLLDHERSAVAGVLRISAGKLGLGSAVLCSWTADASGAEDWTYPVGSSRMHVSAAGWAVWDGAYFDAGVSGGISTSRFCMPALWAGAGCSWKLNRLQGHAGVFLQSEGVRTAGGDVLGAARGAVIEGEFILISGVTLSAGYRWSLSENPRQPDNAVTGNAAMEGAAALSFGAADFMLAGEYRISGSRGDETEHIGISLEAEFHGCSLPWSAEASWKPGEGYRFTVSGEHQAGAFTFIGSIETALHNRKASFSSLRITVEASSGQVSSSVRYVSSRGLSLSFTGSVPIYPR